ncbi:23S rRNA (adenine(2503)-C(2))-methyltransferase RlmN, partial [Peptococcaceae bacterium]|nr:23S rRNA (adenine(2503)-C(2))-methyltransferase RlmN [Peptococcaceae bacterium]
CISTQVGCRMSCDFCASTIDGLVRNLSAGEMYDQVLAIQKDIGERVSHVVLMGSGEPLENYENTVRFIRNITAEDGLNISCRQITLSTCGLVPEIKKLAAERMPLTLAVSLHAADDQIRDRLMPINRRYPLAKLIPACKDYATATGRRVTFEYALIKDVNDQLEQATKLAQMLKRMLAHVNLIPVNPVKERGLERSAKEQVIKFQKELQNCGINVTIRKEMGTDIDAACGQLRRKHVCEAH